MNQKLEMKIKRYNVTPQMLMPFCSLINCDTELRAYKIKQDPLNRNVPIFVMKCPKCGQEYETHIQYPLIEMTNRIEVQG